METIDHHLVGTLNSEGTYRDHHNYTHGAKFDIIWDHRLDSIYIVINTVLTGALIIIFASKNTCRNYFRLDPQSPSLNASRFQENFTSELPHDVQSHRRYYTMMRHLQF